MSRVSRWLVTSAGALAVLVGVVVVAAAYVGHQGPVDWLDRNTERTGDGTWLAQEAPLAVADRMAAATRPRSRVVSSWGVALRYAGGTATVVAGPRPQTATIYWDGTSGAVRRYRFGRLGWGTGDGPEDTGGGGSGGGNGGGPGVPGRGAPPRSSSFAEVTPDAAVQTRRGEDFRGGGPGSGK